MSAPCKHKFVHKSTDSFYRDNGRYSKIYTSIDYYFCEKCLHEEEKKKTLSIADHETLPDWAKSITKKVL
jgi:hypothetical protein